MEELYKKIEKKAYEYFLERGMAHGNDIGDWLRAEKDIVKELGNQIKDKKRTKKPSFIKR